MVFNHLTCPTFYRRRIGLRKDSTNSCGGRGSSEQDIDESKGEEGREKLRCWLVCAGLRVINAFTLHDAHRSFVLQ